MKRSLISSQGLNEVSKQFHTNDVIVDRSDIEMGAFMYTVPQLHINGT